jgi:hypothetical protein
VDPALVRARATFRPEFAGSMSITHCAPEGELPVEGPAPVLPRG